MKALRTTRGGPFLTPYVAGASFAPLGGTRVTCPAASPGLQPSMDQQAWYLPWRSDHGPWGIPRLLIGDLQFHAVGPLTGNTFVQAFFNPLTDGWGDNNYLFSLNADLGSATVVPEPAAVFLVGCGFLGLLAVARGRRRENSRKNS